MKKLIIICAVAFMMLTGCSKNTEVTEDVFYTFTDSVGNEVTLVNKPERVAVLFSSFAQIWQLAGGEVAVTVGDSITRGFADDGTPLVNETAGLKIDMEALVAAEPDFVIVTADLSAQVDAADLMKELEVPVALFRVEDFNDYLYVLNIMTDITENKDVYKTYGTELNEQMDAYLAEFNSMEHKDLSYLFIRAGSGFSSTKAKTAEDHFACVMLDTLGATNIVDSGSALTESISIEQILVKQPDVIIIAPQGNEDNARAYMDELFKEDGYSDLEAVKNNRVYFVSKELFNYKPNQRWLEAYKVLEDILYEEK